MSAPIYKAELSRYFLSPEVVLVSLVVPALLAWYPQGLGLSLGEPQMPVDSIQKALLVLCLPNLVDLLFLLRSFLTQGFIMQTKVGGKVGSATSLFLVTTSLLRSFVMIAVQTLRAYLYDRPMPEAPLFVRYSLISSAYVLIFVVIGVYLGRSWLAAATTTLLTSLGLGLTGPVLDFWASHLDSEIILGSIFFIVFFLLSYGAIRMRAATLRE